MRKFLKALTIYLLCSHFYLHAQVTVDLINENSIRGTINILASDSLKGRGPWTPELFKAADFIGSKFRKAGLYPLTGNTGFYFPFSPYDSNTKLVDDELVWNDKVKPSAEFNYFPRDPGVHSPRNLNHFTVIKLDSSFTTDILWGHLQDTTPLMLWTDKLQSDGKNYFPPKLTFPPMGLFREILLVYSESPATSLTINSSPVYFKEIGYNMVGMLPGRSKPDEVIIFSAHYDHVGLDSTGKGDNIFNGANDNASGTAALIALAEYFGWKGDNERTIMFCAFSAEELGLLGSASFVQHIVPEKIVAVINIEMIGVPQFGPGRIFFTGANYSNMPRLLDKPLVAAGLRITREPTEALGLFERSDNFPFAKLGVPAHTIMSSDDADKCYHQTCDETSRIDVKHMTKVIRAIALGTQALIDGAITPKRIKAKLDGRY